MPSNATTATVYSSTFRFGVDPKRRVQVPSAWRPADEGTEFTLIVWPKYSEGICLRVMPPKKLEELFATLAGLPNDAELEEEIRAAAGETGPSPEAPPKLPPRFTRKSSGWK